MRAVFVMIGLAIATAFGLNAQTNTPPAPDIWPSGGIYNNTFSAYIQGVSNSWIYAWDPNYSGWQCLGREYGYHFVEPTAGKTNRVYAYQYVVLRGNSPTTYRDYIFKVAAPSVQRSGPWVSLSTATSSATIYYRTNSWATNWMVYGGTFYAPTNSVSAWAGRANFFNSDVTQE
jgi:hypothetical protein